MKARFTQRMLAVVAGCTLLGGASQAAVLYDPGAGTLPSQQGWTTQGFGSFTQSVSGGVYHFDSGPSNLTSAGSALGDPPGHAPLSALDTAAGFTLDFSLKVVSESHAASNTRAGFSVLFTGLDPQHSLELGFWGDRVFAYDYLAPNTFTPGANAPLDTSVMRNYSLQVQGNLYTLSSGGTSLLQGALVDYTPRGLVYADSGLLFFGDDTTGARSSVELGMVSLSPIPEPASAALLVAGLAALGLRRRSAVR
ncbi:hypothetical protein BH11PSE8_BH11PSE8_26350 [soil metagenome]